MFWLPDFHSPGSPGIHNLWQDAVKIEAGEALLEVSPELWIVPDGLHVILSWGPEEEHALAPTITLTDCSVNVL